MKSLHLIWFHFRRISFQNWGLLGLTILFPFILICSLLFMIHSESSSMVSGNYVVINHSEYIETEILPRLEESYQDSFVEDEAKAYAQMNQAEISMIYEIPQDFLNSNEPIQVYSLNGTNQDSFFETMFTKVLSEARVDEVFEEADIQFEEVEVAQPHVQAAYPTIDEQLVLVIFMIVFFMFYTANYMAGDLAKMRNSGLLTRSLVSNTFNWQIMGSVLAAYTLYNILISLFLLFSISLLFGIPITNFALIFSMIIAFCVFMAGFTMILFRIFKNEALIQNLGMIFSVIIVFIPLIAPSLGDFSIIQYISPYYWLLDALDTGQFLPHVFIVILYGLVLFTAGSFKIERFARA